MMNVFQCIWLHISQLVPLALCTVAYLILRAKRGLEQQALLSGGLDRRTPNKVDNSQKQVSISGTYYVTLECADQTLERFSFITHWIKSSILQIWFSKRITPWPNAVTVDHMRSKMVSNFFQRHHWEDKGGTQPLLSLSKKAPHTTIKHCTLWCTVCRAG